MHLAMAVGMLGLGDESVFCSLIALVVQEVRLVNILSYHNTILLDSCHRTHTLLELSPKLYIQHC
jgi:hypothetical protein